MIFAKPAGMAGPAALGVAAALAAGAGTLDAAGADASKVLLAVFFPAAGTAHTVTSSMAAPMQTSSLHDIIDLSDYTARGFGL